MPILAAEPAWYPDNLFESSNDAAPSERRWYVVHTPPRQEKTLARSLRPVGVPFYLPLILKRRRSRSRTLMSYIPLFRGYVFVWADVEERILALKTKRILHQLEVANQEQLWRELRQIERLIATGARITPEDRFAKGMTVTIRSGPLAGMEGTILRSASQRRFVVNIDFIQHGASVLLNDFDLAESA